MTVQINKTANTRRVCRGISYFIFYPVRMIDCAPLPGAASPEYDSISRNAPARPTVLVVSRIVYYCDRRFYRDRCGTRGRERRETGETGENDSFVSTYPSRGCGKATLTSPLQRYARAMHYRADYDRLLTQRIIRFISDRYHDGTRA